MNLNVIYDTSTGEVLKWTSAAPDLAEGEGVIQTSEKLLGKTWKVNLSTLGLEEVLRGVSWDDVRLMRNGLLRNTDHLAIPDYPMSAEERTAVSAYRQALRDITKTYASPDAVVWPLNPLG